MEVSRPWRKTIASGKARIFTLKSQNSPQLTIISFVILQTQFRRDHSIIRWISSSKNIHNCIFFLNNFFLFPFYSSNFAHLSNEKNRKEKMKIIIEWDEKLFPLSNSLAVNFTRNLIHLSFSYEFAFYAPFMFLCLRRIVQSYSKFQIDIISHTLFISIEKNLFVIN